MSSKGRDGTKDEQDGGRRDGAPEKTQRRGVGRPAGARDERRRRTRHSWPYELRVEVVRQVLERGSPLALISKACGISPLTIKGWIKLAKDGRLPGFFLGICLSTYDCYCVKNPDMCREMFCE